MWKVAISDLGTMYEGRSKALAWQTFHHYKALAQRPEHRAFGKVVQLFNKHRLVAVHDVRSVDVATCAHCEKTFPAGYVHVCPLQ